MKFLSKFFRLSLLIFLLSLILNSAYGSQMPRFLGTEKKFRSYVYNPNDVYRYIGHYTYEGFIEFEEGETVATISMGDPSLWLFEHLGNRLFLKPIGNDLSETNMTVITNKKIYHFELTAREATGLNDPDLIFVAKFFYPDERDKNIIEFAKAPASNNPDMRDLSSYNFNYQYVGEPSIAPLKVFDNGEFTYFEFGTKNSDIPAIFSVDASGYESLVNFRASGPYIIVERVSPQFSLRNGSSIVCVYNDNLYSNGHEDKNDRKRQASGSAPLTNLNPIRIGDDRNSSQNYLNPLMAPQLNKIPDAYSNQHPTN
jgi:type IV secretion system protein VirB9